MIDVAAAILVKENKVLIAKRKLEKSQGGYWEFPGGKVEKGETPSESLSKSLINSRLPPQRSRKLPSTSRLKDLKNEQLK